MSYTLKTIECGPLGANCHLLYKEGKCVAVDPSDDAPVLALLNEEGLSLTHILATHGHFDHIAGIAALSEKTGAVVCAHEADGAYFSNTDEGMAAMMGISLQPVQVDIPLNDGMLIEASGFSIRVMHTPGHSAGSVCYVLDDERILFSGDTLFRLNIGRYDLPGSNGQALFHSISEKLFRLEGDYTVYPGHMRSTTLAFERKHNPYCRQRGK